MTVATRERIGSGHLWKGHLAVAREERAEVTEFGVELRAPRVSVVVPSYNRRSLLLETLSGLSRQRDAPPFEVVVADDASSDGTVEALLRRAGELGLTGRIAELPQNRGPATARNVALLHSRSEIIAFTDSDCVPSPAWLAAGVAAFTSPDVGIVQGRTQAAPGAGTPFFSHFIQTPAMDGSFSTSNAFYRKSALLDVGGFDPECRDWEDRDLGARVLRTGRQAAFEPKALVYHQVLPQTPWQWMRWPTQFATWPRWTRRYPEARRYLFARFWVEPRHAALTLAIAGIALAAATPASAVLALPYLATFARKRGLKGRWPPVKAALYLWWDLIGWVTLVASSLRHRSLVL